MIARTIKGLKVDGFVYNVKIDENKEITHTECIGQWEMQLRQAGGQGHLHTLQRMIDNMRLVCKFQLVCHEGEYRVVCYDQNDKRYREADYFTDDFDDAYATIKMMMGDY